MSHLIHLAPDIQAAILLGECRASEHLLRPLCRMADWGEQGRAFALRPSSRHIGLE